jgi:SAM-dependent methyltransferase
MGFSQSVGSAGMNDKTDAVRSQYEAYSYPPPINDIAALVQKGTFLDGDPSLFSVQFWPEGRPKEALNILVAGCGTSQAARFAFSNPKCTVVGIDLSEASLAHEQYLKDKHSLENLNLLKLDLRELSRLKRGSFDLIYCTGVLHHLTDPDDGLRALAAVLAPHGHMSLMVYGQAGRAGVYLIQDALRILDVKQNADGVKFTRDLIKMLPRTHYLNSYSSKVWDLESDAGLVDSLLHPQDRAYTSSEVIAFVERCGLSFAGWQDNGLYYPDRYVPEGTPLWESLAKISDRKQWAVIENLSLSMITHNFFACQPERLRAGIDFANSDWPTFVPSIHPTASTSVDGDQRKVTRAGTTVTLSEVGRFFWEQVDGRRSIAEIANDSTLAVNSESVRMDAALKFFSRMWRLGNLFYSKPRR